MFDLAERVYPAEEQTLTDEEAALELAERRLVSLGIARTGSLAQKSDPVDVDAVGEAATVDGTEGLWRVDAALLGDGAFRPRTALLSPFDRLVFDRQRLSEAQPVHAFPGCWTPIRRSCDSHLKGATE